MAIRLSRETLASMLLQYGEDELAGRAPSLTDDEMTRIGTLAAYYAWSEDALAFGGSMGGARAISLATVDVLEPGQRELRRHHSLGEIENFGWSAEPEAWERDRDRALRRHAAVRQLRSSG